MDPSNSSSDDANHKMTAETIDLTRPETVDLTHEATTKRASSGITAQRKRRRDDTDDEVVIVNESNANKKPAVFFDCSVCLETALERFRGYQLTGCCHLFCRECLYGFIQNKLQEKTAGRALVCPEVGCQRPIHSADIRACTLEVGDHVSWQSYQELSTEAYLDSAVPVGQQQQTQTTASLPAPSRLCRCPTNHCNFTFEFDRPANPLQGQLFACPACQQAYCLHCPVVDGKVGPAHNNSCLEVMEEIQQSEERQRKMEEWKKENAQADVRFRELLEREGAAGKTKPCPKCHTAITKNGGCLHMHCTRCHTDFNWS